MAKIGRFLVTSEQNHSQNLLEFKQSYKMILRKKGLKCPQIVQNRTIFKYTEICIYIYINCFSQVYRDEWIEFRTYMNQVFFLSILYMYKL